MIRIGFFDGFSLTSPVLLSRGKKSAPFYHTLFELKSMQDSLAEQRETCSSIPHPFDQLQLVDMTLNQSIVLGEGQPCHHRGLVALNTGSKPLQFTNLACSGLLKPCVRFVLAAATCSQVAGQQPLQSLAKILENVEPICTLDGLGSGSLRC
jgi:hypothetical protein